MSDNNLRLQVVLGAVDKLTRPFKNAQAGSKALASALKASKDNLRNLNEQSARIDGFRKLRTQLEGTKNDLTSARQKVAALAKEFAATSNPTKKQAKELEQAKRQASQLKDAYNGLQQSVQRQRGALNAAGIDTKQLSSAQRRLRTDAQAATGAIARQQAELRKLGERQQKLAAIRSRYEKTQALRGRMAGAGVSMVAHGGAALLGIRSTVNEASRYDMELAGFKALGVGDSTLKEADKFARGMNIIGNSATDNLKTLKEAHAVLRDFHEAKIVAPELARLQYATRFMASHGVSDDAAEHLRDQAPAVLKIAELRNQINNPEDFKKSVNMSAQAMAASGGMVLPEDYLAMMKTGGIAAKQLDNKSFYFGMSHIIQQIGGNRAGTQLSSAYQNLMMGRTTQGAATELMDLGLLDKGAVEYGKTGHIKKIKPGALTNNELYLNDPFSYLMQEIVPRIQKKHPKLDERGMETAIAKLFSNRTAGDLFVTMFRERANIGKQIKAGQEAYSVDQLVSTGKNTAQGQGIDLEAKKRDLYLQMGQDVLPLYVSALEKVSSVLSRVTAFMREHASAAKAITLSLTGFALLTTGVGALALAATSVMGPMALLRLSLGVFNVKLPGIGAAVMKFGGVLAAAFRMAGNAVLILGRAMLANPILAIIGLIAAGAIYIWRNWDTLGPKFKSMWDAVCNAASAAWEWIKNTASTAWEGIKSLFFNYTLPGLIAKNWDAIKTGVSEAWASIRQSISDKWNSILDDVAALPAKFQDMGSAIIDSILNGINSKWEALKNKLSSVTDYLPDWMTGNNKTQYKAKVQVVGGAAAAAVPFAGMYDSGGAIPRGQFGIVGENGPEIVNGPANVTSRRRTAALASVVAGVMGVAAAPAEAAPLHPYSLPTTAYNQRQPAKSASVPPVIHYEINAPIQITAQPGQSAQDIAREVARQLDERERRARAKARSNFSDQGGY
ncbi:phage tail tape measure protein [Pantoea stewartii]|uniref:phage tail tape measure protein n=1 Tax=Pantoea stewartii TaxID=66269 RepID=UPI0020117A0F|nr:phage tail tape measure protein [Pantoea stewartii]